ncbi:hypothetical protein [uncultured Tolumonas sp.]|uniref:hypothetical protein n=1 Tax=uncultured Tolumonas sp. TaxID=263765 RepID=UPI00293077EF|nr:hypothetical protein [uncultured Tolumonas sp.]
MNKTKRSELQQGLIFICLLCVIYSYFCIKNMLPFPDPYVLPRYESLYTVSGIIEKDMAESHLVGRVHTGRPTLLFINDGNKTDFYLCSRFFIGSCSYFKKNWEHITLSSDVYAVPIHAKWYPYMKEKLIYEAEVDGKPMFNYNEMVDGYKYDYKQRLTQIENEKKDLKKALIILLITLVIVIKNEWKNRKV